MARFFNQKSAIKTDSSIKRGNAAHLRPGGKIEKFLLMENNEPISLSIVRSVCIWTASVIVNGNDPHSRRREKKCHYKKDTSCGTQLLNARTSNNSRERGPNSRIGAFHIRLYLRAARDGFVLWIVCSFFHPFE